MNSNIGLRRRSALEQLEARLVLSASLGQVEMASHEVSEGPIAIAEGESQTVIGPHHADGGHGSFRKPNNSKTHYFAVTRDPDHFAWFSATPETPGPITIKYDFRDIGEFKNEITSGQEARAVDALNAWSGATGGKVVFIQDGAASDADILNIGTGDLAALGFTSGPGGTLALGGGDFTHTATVHSITGGVAWQDFAESWDETIGNGNPPGTFDYFTVVAQEIGHALGLGHANNIVGQDLMDGSYSGEQTAASVNDIDHIQTVYGVSAADDNTAPIISDVAASGITDNAATITWTTDEAADSKVDFGPDTGYGSTATDLTLVASHSITLTGLTADTLYHYQVTSADGSGNAASSITDFTFTTTSVPVGATAVTVGSVTYATYGGKLSDKHLSITVALLNNLTEPVAGASVSIDLNLNGSPSPYASYTGTTGTDGSVTFSRNNAPSGTYTTTVTDVIAGLTWDSLTPPNSFPETSGAVSSALAASEPAQAFGGASLLLLAQMQRDSLRSPAAARATIKDGSEARDDSKQPGHEVLVVALADELDATWVTERFTARAVDRALADFEGTEEDLPMDFVRGLDSNLLAAD